MVRNTFPPPSRPRPLAQRDCHQLVTLRCSTCSKELVRDQWLGLGGAVDENMEEAEHALTGCNGQVSIVRTHRHTDNCRCMIPVRPAPKAPELDRSIMRPIGAKLITGP